jgi:hypothetical protein
LEILVICEESDSVRGSFQVMAPLFDCCNNGPELLVIDRVIEFCRAEFRREKGNRVEVTPRVRLT